jgi:uncharacterized protein with HEPN domain
MRRKVLNLLADMESTGHLIESRMRGSSKTEYLSNITLRHAVEREFEIVGEALRRLTDEYPEFRERFTDSQQVIGFRNVLAHGYDAIDDARVWEIARVHLPILLAEIRSLIDEEKNRL